MKHLYSGIIAIAFIFSGSYAAAQCTSCTTTISSADASGHVVGSGQTLCITSAGSCSGLITITSGGTVCNLGTISSNQLWVNGGTLENYHIINSNNILVSGQGTFNNHNTANAAIDSLLVDDIYSVFTNEGILTGDRLAATDLGDINNFGDITEDYVGDSSAQFNNYHNLWINFDFANSYGSGFFNSGYTKINRHFYNSTSATFQTYCMVTVGGDWYNSAVVQGPGPSGCGGFNIAGASYNTGTVGGSSDHVDLCDAGNPTWGIDGPGGTIASTTTYCSCTNNCAVMAGIEAVAESTAMITSLYPNPAVNSFVFEIETANPSELKYEVIDMMGRSCFSAVLNAGAGKNKVSMDVSSFAEGTYILSIVDEKKLSVKKMFSVVR
jgi:hypothetical protein